MTELPTCPQWVLKWLWGVLHTCPWRVLSKLDWEVGTEGHNSVGICSVDKVVGTRSLPL